MAQILDKQGLQHYANKMCNADNRKVGSKNLPTALNEIDIAIDGFKTLFETEYGTPVNMELENNENVFSIGTGTNIDKKDDVENSFTDVELSGNSLVNLCPVRTISHTKIDDVQLYSFKEFHCPLVKVNTTYTVFVNITKNPNSVSGMTLFTFIHNGGLASEEKCFTNQTGYQVFTLTTKNMEVPKGIKFRFANSHGGDLGTYECTDLVILEGDWTNKPIPQYFEGMKSVGQDDVNGHKIEILSKNRNEYEGKTQYLNDNATILSKEDNECIFEHRQINQGLKIDIEKYKGKEIVLSYNVELLEGSTLNWGGHNRHSQIAYYIDGIKQDASYHSGKPISMEIGRTYKIDVVLRVEDMPEQYIHDYKYIGIAPNRYSSNTPTYTKVKITNFQITQSRELYPYIQPKLDKKEISLNEPLRGLPNGIRDTIEKVNGEWKIVRRCKQTTLTGDNLTEFVVGAEGTSVGQDVNRLSFILNDVKYKTNSTPFICDKFSYVNFHTTPNGSTERNIEAISFHSKNSKELNVHLLKTKLSEQTSASAKSWLNANPVTVVYELENYIIEDISPVTLQCWKNGTISIDEVLPVETTHTVALNKSAQIQKNIEELSILRNRIKALEKQYDNSTLNQAYELELLRLDMQLDNII